MKFNRLSAGKTFLRLSFFIFCSLLINLTSVYGTPLSPFIDLQEQGLTISSGSVGLQGFSGTTRQIQVNVGGTVRFALLYWTGRDTNCPVAGTTGNCTIPSQPYKDQQMIFNGTPLTGTLIGTEQSGGPTNNIGYFADVTSIVAATGTGLKTFNVQDGDVNNNLSVLNGMSLVVAYTNASDSAFYRVLVQDGLDFVFGNDATAGDPRTTNPVTLNHGTITSNRFAQLLVIGGNATASQADNITISNNPTIFDSLNSSSGNTWDNDTFSINIPANVGSTTVQVNTPAGANPDAFLWEAVVLRTALIGPTAASVTVSGRVTTQSGRGITNVQITLIDSNGIKRTTQTTAFGYYRFDNVTAGETVTLSAKARRFRFTQSSIVTTPNESISNADFVSEQ